MREIFISYRRIDAEGSDGHLHGDLCRAFGEQAVFMDRRGARIPWGADWERALDNALAGCEVLIALIGPQWLTCTRTGGGRRLDAPDDWVRNEIATALRRSKTVLPVLIKGASWPQKDELPSELQDLGFAARTAYPVSEDYWATDFKLLVEELVKSETLKRLHDLETTEKGIRLLQSKIAENPLVADAVSRSRVVIENTDREVDEIRLLKDIHDALHEIEAKCLIPIRAADGAPRLAGSRRKFVQLHRGIHRQSRELARVFGEMPALLQSDLPLCAKAAFRALRTAAKRRGVDDQDRAVAALEALVNEIPVRLNDSIDSAGRRLELKQLQRLMATVGDLLRPPAAGHHELGPLLDGIAALDGLGIELARRVREHGLLQSLDNLLRNLVAGQHRPGTAGRVEPVTLRANWNAIDRLRANFKEPFSPEVAEGLRTLRSLEKPIGEQVACADVSAAMDLLAEYANEVGDLFRDVDRRLKEFCFDLRANTLSLKKILDMCRKESHHV